jgi:hypothetical protein
MVRASPNFNTFDAGEFAPLTEGRTDLQRYGFACRLLENFLPRVVGPASRRPGTQFIASTRYPDKTAQLVRFEYSAEQAYCLEFGDLYVRFYRDDAPLLEVAKVFSGASQANPVVLSGVTHGYTTGDDIEVSSNVARLDELAGRRFRVTVLSSTTVSLQDMHGNNIDGTGFTLSGGSTSVRRVYTLTTTYQEADLTTLKFAQSADVLYIAHTEYVPRKLQRYAATKWVLSQIDFQDGPYLPQNSSQATLAVSATSGAAITISAALTMVATAMADNGSGAVRVTKSAHGWKTNDRIDIAGTVGTVEANGTWTVTRVNANTFDLNASTFVNAWVSGGTITPHIFESTDTGRIIRIQHASGADWGYAKITAYTSAVSVTADVIDNFGATAASAAWRLGLYSDGGGYPSCVTFYEGRLFWGGCPLTPTRVDGSVSSNYETFTPSSLVDSTVTDDLAVAYPLDSGDVNNVVWMKDDERGLLVGTKGGEWLLRANTLNGILTPSNVKATRGTTYGSFESSQPVRTGKDVMFVQRKQRKLRNLAYEYIVDGFTAGDLTTLASHIGLQRLGQIAFQSEPQGWVYAVRGDGQMPVLTYSREEQKIGWSRQIFGGFSDAARLRHAIVESVVAIPDPNDLRDEIWTITQRTINGVTERYVEVSTAEWEQGDDQWTAFYLDCALVFDGDNFGGFGIIHPGVGADVNGSTGVTFLSGSSDFHVTDIGRQLTYRYFDYSTVDPEFPMQLGMWKTARAAITEFIDANTVQGSILAPWPSLDPIHPTSTTTVRISTQTLTNLWHLEGETLSINAEGATHPDVIVTNGQAALVRPVSYAIAGLKYESRLQTMRIEAGSQDGTAQAKIKRINEVTFRVLQSLGGEVGPDFENMSPIEYRSTGVPLGSPPPITDTDARTLWGKGYETKGRIAVRQSAPFPMTVQAILPQVTAYDKG